MRFCMKKIEKILDTKKNRSQQSINRVSCKKYINSYTKIDPIASSHSVYETFGSMAEGEGFEPSRGL